MYANDPKAPARARLTVPALRRMKAEGIDAGAEGARGRDPTKT